MGYDAPFRGLKAVDISQGVAGPYAGMLLAQYGAEVIKVEPPRGEWGRFISTPYDNHSAFSVIANIGKRGLALDLKEEEGREALRRLIAESDVFIENFRPGVTARLGFSYEEISRINPGIIYVSISGFGNDGPWRERPAMDPVLQAFSGLMSVNRDSSGTPQRIGVVICDMATALYAFQALSVALYARRDEEGKKGRLIETNLMQGGACLGAIRMLSVFLEQGQFISGRVPGGVFETADGHITLIVYKEEEYAALCDILEVPELGEDPRFVTNALRIENEGVLLPLLRAAFKRHSCAALEGKLAGARIMHAKVNNYLDFLEHPQVAATELISWLEHEGTGRIPMPNIPGLPRPEDSDGRSHAPQIGEHSRDVLAGIGYDDTQIDNLAARGITLLAGP